MKTRHQRSTNSKFQHKKYEQWSGKGQQESIAFFADWHSLNAGYSFNVFHQVCSFSLQAHSL